MKRVALMVAVVAVLVLMFSLRTDQRDERTPDIEGAVLHQKIDDAEPIAQSSSSDAADPDSSTECLDDPDKVIRSSEESELIVNNAIASLKTSSDPEHHLAAAALSRWDEPQTALALLKKSAASKTNSALNAWTALIICDQRPQLACDFASLEHEAIRADGKNGAMWMQLVGKRLEEGNDEQAITAMRQAISAAEFNNYFYEQIVLIERALAATSDLSFAERVYTAIGYSAATPMALNTLLGKCDEQKTGVWLELCEQLGERMMVDGSDLMTQMLGTAVKGRALANRGDSAGLQEIEKRKAEIRQTMGTMESNAEWFNLASNDEGVLRGYLQHLGVFGEAAALEWLSSEADRLRELPGYEQCNFEGEMF